MPMKRTEFIFTVAIISFISLIRAIPFIEHGFSLSIDSAGVVRDAYVFTERSPISLFSGEFDGYNNFWPGASISASIFSLSSGLNILISASLFPIISFIDFILILSAISASLYRKHSTLTIALVVGTTTSMILMSIGLVKEGVAYPLFGTALYAVLKEKGDNMSYFIALLSSSALAITHHLTTLVLIVSLWAIFSWSLISLLQYRPIDPLRFSILLAISLLPAFLQYFFLGRLSTLSVASFYLGASLVTWTTLFSLLTVILYSSFEKSEKLLRFFKPAAFTVIPLSILSVYLSNDLGFFGEEWTWYAISLSFSLLFLASALSYSQNIEGMIPWLLFSAVGSIMIFTIYENIPIKVDLLGRLSTFLIIPLAIALVAGLGKNEKKVIFLLVLCYSIIMLFTFFSVQLGIAESPGGFWTFSESELTSGQQLRNIGLQCVSTDVKMSYLFNSFLGIRTSTWNLTTGGNILISDYMTERGMLLDTGKTLRIGDQILAKLSSSSSLVYSNGGVSLFVGKTS